MTDTAQDGLLLVDKHAHCTSHDVVQKARRLLRQKRIGHCGTLDPDATGLLLLTLGRATRLTRFLIRAPKVYEGEMSFGMATDTYDASGEATHRGSTQGIGPLAIAEAMRAREGTYAQSPPPYCAKKVQGVRFYELARKGQPVPETSKEVTVYEFSPQDDFENDRQRFLLRCSSGTYARTLAHEVGERLGCGAHLSALRRLRIGPFEVGAALTLVELEARLGAVTGGEAPDLGPSWVDFDRIPLPFGEVVADTQQESRITHGQSVLLRDIEGEEGDWVRLTNRRRELIAVGTVVERIGGRPPERGTGLVQPKVVFK